ncbi:hypothetical protein ACFYPC_11725 [Streptomyces sp. NPDC005808]|uniref:hypothetical protein n=1 Tax=Streptomyces sp. NPDC005808 TaxID=3364734 RepID=UPI0036C8F4FA
MLRQAVQEIEPTDGTLDHLRRAVPVRRARKRQAVVGMAAAALFIGTAVPALLHVSNASGSNASPSIAGNSSQTQGGSAQGKTEDGGERGVGGSSDTVKEPGKEGTTSTPEATKDAGSGAVTGGAGPTETSTMSVPQCTADQLGGATSTLGDPDSTGTIYGSFAVSNVSTTACAVSGAGSVTTVTQGAADATKVNVVNHVAGDAATSLPDPSTEVASPVLQPGISYVVKFAWVPSETCPTIEPSPDPTPTEDGTIGGTSTDSGGTSTQLVTEDASVDGSVTVSHTDQTGTVTATTTISNACAGTVYRTGMLAPDGS